MTAPPAPAPPVAPRPIPESIATGRLTLPRERRGPGTVVSLVIHGAIVALIFWHGAAILGEGGGGPGPRGGGGGRGRTRAVLLTAPSYSVPQVDIPTPPTVTVPIMPVPVIPLDLARIDVPQPQTNAPTGPATGVGPGTGGGQGAGQGPGVGNAVGPGTGGDSAYIVQPKPLWTTFPFGGKVPSGDHGTYTVQFWVAADGHVTKVVIDPLPKDAGFRREFMDRMRDCRFLPAVTRDGTPVAAPAVIKFTL